MPRKSKKDQCSDMVCGIPRANLEQFARFICPYIEEYFADEKNMAEYQKLKASGKLSQNSHTFNAQKAAADRINCVYLHDYVLRRVVIIKLRSDGY